MAPGYPLSLATWFRRAAAGLDHLLDLSEAWSVRDWRRRNPDLGHGTRLWGGICTIATRQHRDAEKLAALGRALRAGRQLPATPTHMKVPPGCPVLPASPVLNALARTAARSRSGASPRATSWRSASGSAGPTAAAPRAMLCTQLVEDATAAGTGSRLGRVLPPIKPGKSNGTPVVLNCPVCLATGSCQDPGAAGPGGAGRVLLRLDAERAMIWGCRRAGVPHPARTERGAVAALGPAADLSDQCAGEHRALTGADHQSFTVGGVARTYYMEHRRALNPADVPCPAPPSPRLEVSPAVSSRPRRWAGYKHAVRRPGDPLRAFQSRHRRAGPGPRLHRQDRRHADRDAGQERRVATISLAAEVVRPGRARSPATPAKSDALQRLRLASDTFRLHGDPRRGRADIWGAGDIRAVGHPGSGGPFGTGKRWRHQVVVRSAAAAVSGFRHPADPPGRRRHRRRRFVDAPP